MSEKPSEPVERGRERSIVFGIHSTPVEVRKSTCHAELLFFLQEI